VSPGWAEPRKWEDVGPVRRGEDERVEGERKVTYYPL